MIARIMTDNGYYDSIVFAIYKKGWASEVLVFNCEFNALQFVKMWKPTRNVFIYNAEQEGWTIKKKVEGYDWILENVSRRFFKIKINEAILDKCKELQAAVKECEWFEIKNKADVDGLMFASCDFHDSYVKKMYVDDGKQYIHFDATWGCDILLELDENIQTNVFEGLGHIVNEVGEYLQIYDASMFFENGLIYWVDDESVQSSLNLDKSKWYYFCAKNIKWKLILNHSKIWGTQL